MIPYDDLVAALSNWRAKQGLPGGALAATPAPTATSGSGPASKSGPKSAPPGAPPKAVAAAPVADAYDVDDAALLEEASYDSGDDATSIGEVPSPSDGLTNDMTLDEDMPRRSGSGPSKKTW